MTPAEKLERSKSDERIDFDKISCEHVDDPLVPIESSPKIMVEPIWTFANDFEGRMYADYQAQHPEYNQIYVRQGLHERLMQAAESLPDNLKLVVRAGHRPSEVQRRLLRDCIQDYKNEHEGASDAEALAHARTFVSDPDIKLPPHCCGAGVDVDLFDTEKNDYVDFGSPVNIDEEISFLHTTKINDQQKTNRMQLLETMLRAGFSSYYAEWWHYPYGDQIWAWFYGKDSCLYDVIDHKN